jgi:hypothetical protein
VKRWQRPRDPLNPVSTAREIEVERKMRAVDGEA